LQPWLDRLLTDFAAQKPAALARAVSIVENHRDGYDDLMSVLHPKLGRARRLGVTGPPGAGKSTLMNLLIRDLRQQGLTVGVIAVDPTSPFTGGALLGDRVRMESVSLDPGVFIRSMATRGSLGGLSAVTAEVADVLDAFGFDRVLIETVGVGQIELDIARTADTTVVVLVPESGDSIQTLKAGVMEIADIFVVNKADRPGADRLRNDIELMLGLRTGLGLSNVPAHHGVQLQAVGASARREDGGDAPRYTNPARLAREAAKTASPDRWTPPVLRAIAAQEEGVEEILGALERHFHYLETTGELRERRRRRLRDRVVDVVEQRLQTRLWRDSVTNAWIDAQLPALERGTTTPFEVADALLRVSGPLLAGTLPER
jgi:LAO/AO transport system kinase